MMPELNQTPVIRPWTRLPDYDDPAHITCGLLEFDLEKCKRCGICARICPARSIRQDRGARKWRNGFPYLRSAVPGIKNCIACGCCLAVCPETAIRIERGYYPGRYFRRLTQSREMSEPRTYTAGDEEKSPRHTEVVASPLAGTESARVKQGAAASRKLQKARLLKDVFGGLGRWGLTELRRGRLPGHIRAMLTRGGYDLSWAELMEHCAREVPAKIFLKYKKESYTYLEMDRNANRAARFLLELGGDKGKGVGIMMRNSPRYLDLFLGAQKIGMYVVTINPELKGDGLAYLINHSDMELIVVDAELLESLTEISGELENIRHTVVNDVEEEVRGDALPANMISLGRAYDHIPKNPMIGYNPEDKCLIIYTSGTTGLPKGVVYRYRRSGVMKLCLLGNVLLKPRDVYFTCLSLCHGNALFVTFTMTLGVKGTMVMARQFSASRFWDTIRSEKITVFNTIGSMVPILMKQPERPTDRENKVRFVMSSACPANIWEAFESRFGVKIYEGYGAVDGGGKAIFNLGTAPVGSLGKPGKSTVIRIVDDSGEDRPPGTPGELLFKAGNRVSRVEYYKNPEASRKKTGGGWIHTGDLVLRDASGYLYFVGRNTESMRKGGENVSAYEVENEIMKHPDVEEVAVYAVPSDLAEDEIMASVKLVAGKAIPPDLLHRFCSERLARYAVPRYLRFVDDFPKTNTHRIIKGALEKQGVTGDTYDAKPDRN